MHWVCRSFTCAEIAWWFTCFIDFHRFPVCWYLLLLFTGFYIRHCTVLRWCVCYVYMFIYVLHVWRVHGNVFALMWRPEVALRCLLSLPMVYMEVISILSAEPADVASIALQLVGSPLCLPSTGRRWAPHWLHVHECSSKIRSLCKHFCPLSHIPSPAFLLSFSC